MASTPSFSLKDQLFHEAKVRFLAESCAAVYPAFPVAYFMELVMSRLLQCELKERIYLIAEALGQCLPSDFEVAAAIVAAALPPPLSPEKTDGDFGDFIFAPFGEYVVRYGMKPEHVALSLATLEALTMRFSMEDAIRHFIRQYPRETLTKCLEWVRHPHYHVRRLVSEGTRPRLPWSGRIALVPAETLPLLSILYADQTRYVTRSVANHLNDLAKTDSALVVATLRTWQRDARQTSREFAWLSKHALRTLVKAGHGDALAFLGYLPAAVSAASLAVSPNIARGEVLTLLALVTVRESTPAVVDYRIHFIKKSGAAVKVFKWKTTTLVPGTTRLEKRQLLKAAATTFTLYPGVHVVELQVNGEVVAATRFTLT